MDLAQWNTSELRRSQTTNWQYVIWFDQIDGDTPAALDNWKVKSKSRAKNRKKEITRRKKIGNSLAVSGAVTIGSIPMDVHKLLMPAAVPDAHTHIPLTFSLDAPNEIIATLSHFGKLDFTQMPFAFACRCRSVFRCTFNHNVDQGEFGPWPPAASSHCACCGRAICANDKLMWRQNLHQTLTPNGNGNGDNGDGVGVAKWN